MKRFFIKNTNPDGYTAKGRACELCEGKGRLNLSPTRLSSLICPRCCGTKIERGAAV